MVPVHPIPSSQIVTSSQIVIEQFLLRWIVVVMHVYDPLAIARLVLSRQYIG